MIGFMKKVVLRLIKFYLSNWRNIFFQLEK